MIIFWLLPQPHDILLRDSPGPPDLVSGYPFRPQSPVDRLRIDVEGPGQFLDGEIAAHGETSIFLKENGRIDFFLKLSLH